MLQNDFKRYVRDQKKGLAAVLNIPDECIRVITKEEYEAATEEED